MVAGRGQFKRFYKVRLGLSVLAMAIMVPAMACAEAGPQDRGYFAMRLPDAAIAGLSGQIQPVILPLEEGYYRYSESAFGTQYAQGAYNIDPINPPQTPAMSEHSTAKPEWGAYDDWGGWQEYVGR